MVPIRWDPDRQTLSQFSEAWMFAFGMIAAPLSLWRGHPGWAVGFWGMAVLGRVVGMVAPSLLRPVFVGMTLMTWPIGWVMSHLALAIVYYGTITPIGLFRRAFGRGALQRTLDPGAISYWSEVRPNPRPDRYFRQF